jgi:hypothetical protein
LTWAASNITPLAEYGWGSFVFAGLVAACTISLVMSTSLVAWRYFNPRPVLAAPAAEIAPVRPKLNSRRIPLVEFMRAAEARGWKISGMQDLEGIDLLEGLRQAAIYGELNFWGRRNEFGTRTLTMSQPHVQIPQDHWSVFQIDWSIIGHGENFDSQTYVMGRSDKATAGGYVDILLDDHNAAIDWLQSPTALEFKGRQDRIKRGRQR